MENHWWGLQTPRRLFTCDWCSVCNHLQFPPLDTQENYNINLESSNRSLKSIPHNLVDQVWKERPPIQPDSLTRLPDRVIRGFACVSVSAAHTHTNTHCSLPVCRRGAFYVCADKYLQTGSNKQPHKYSDKEPVYVFTASWQIKKKPWGREVVWSSMCLICLYGWRTNPETNGEHHKPNALRAWFFSVHLCTVISAFIFAVSYCGYESFLLCLTVWVHDVHNWMSSLQMMQMTNFWKSTNVEPHSLESFIFTQGSATISILYEWFTQSVSSFSSIICSFQTL